MGKHDLQKPVFFGSPKKTRFSRSHFGPSITGWTLTDVVSWSFLSIKRNQVEAPPTRKRTLAATMLSTALALWCTSSYLVTGFSGQSVVARPSSTTLFAEEVNKQAEYGKAIELPDTYVKCGKCQAIYAITEEDLGKGRGRRLSCSVCDHSWFQSKDRLMTVNDNFELIPLPEPDKERISQNIKEGKHPGFVGDAKLYVGNIAFECHEDDLMESVCLTRTVLLPSLRYLVIQLSLQETFFCVCFWEFHRRCRPKWDTPDASYLLYASARLLRSDLLFIG
eukprot:scaffold3233_cov178-Amphora_coffeaeformis.AAC.7